MGKYYAVLQGAYSTIAVNIEYTYHPQEEYLREHVDIHGVTRVSDGKRVEHLLDRWLGEDNYLEYLADIILDHEKEHEATKKELFRDY